MRIDHQKVKQIIKTRGESLYSFLKKIGVSRTAYYSLKDRPAVVPRSLITLASSLDVSLDDLLMSEELEITKARFRELDLQEIVEEYPDADPENLWHTLILLEMSPIERLAGAIRRGRASKSIQ